MLNTWALSEGDYITDVSTPTTFNLKSSYITPSAEFGVKSVERVYTKLNPALYLDLNLIVAPDLISRRSLTHEENNALWLALQDATTLISKGRLVK